MTEQKARWDLDLDRAADDFADDDGWYGYTPVEPAAVAQDDYVEQGGSDEQPRVDTVAGVGDGVWDDSADTDRWYLPVDIGEEARQSATTRPEAVIAEPTTDHAGRSAAFQPADSWETTLSGIGNWDFKVSPSLPWYRSTGVRVGVITAAAAAVAIPVVFAMLGDSAVDTPRESPSVPRPPATSVYPTASDTASPSVPPPAPPAPALPSPPPPPNADVERGSSAPVYTRPRSTAPSEQGKPEIGVTRTPATRAPISAERPAPQPPANNSATPGDGPKRRRGFF